MSDLLGGTAQHLTFVETVPGYFQTRRTSVCQLEESWKLYAQGLDTLGLSQRAVQGLKHLARTLGVVQSWHASGCRGRLRCWNASISELVGQKERGSA